MRVKLRYIGNETRHSLVRNKIYSVRLYQNLGYIWVSWFESKYKMLEKLHLCSEITVPYASLSAFADNWELAVTPMDSLED